MSEKIRILGVDPSLRNTGVAIITYDAEKKEFLKPSHCQVLVNPAKFTGTDAIMNMLDLIQEISKEKSYQDVDNVIVESPSVMFNKAWAGGTISSIAHISGGAVALLGIEKAYIFRPNEWNKSRKKEATHNQTVAVLGNPDNWHYEKRVKSEKYMEHIMDAASLALWWIKNNYIDEEE